MENERNILHFLIQNRYTDFTFKPKIAIRKWERLEIMSKRRS